MSWLSRAIRKVAGETVSKALPGDLLAALDARRFELISPAIRAWCAGQASRADPGPLLAAARQRGWNDREIEKLDILVGYYGGDLNEAFERARNHITGKQFDADLFVICLVALYRNNQFEDAYRFLQLAAKHADSLADRGDYWLTRAIICWTCGDMGELKAAADRMCALSPDETIVLENACGMYLELGDMAAFEAARLKLTNGSHQPGYTFSLSILATGDYEEGFRRMEARYDMEEAPRYLNRGLFERPRWHGESLAGKTLLVSAEQGLGDTIQMARYLPELVQQAGRVAMETPMEIMCLLSHNIPELEIVAGKYGVSPELTFDFWTGSMSLPHRLGATAANIPGRAGYLRVPPENADYWRRRAAELGRGGRPRIGLAWSGDPRNRANLRRAIPFDRMMQAIRDIDADFFALQTKVPQAHPANLIDVSEELLTLADTAAVIEQMDWVISVDTSVPHIAGALGKETWLLLAYRWEWRWGLEGEENHWYDSVRVLRQRRHGDWDSLLDEVFNRRLPERRRLQGSA